MDDNEDKRRERAYRIWEEEGRPEGRHADHWQRAEDQHETTEEEADKELEIEAETQKLLVGRKNKTASSGTP